jgi:2,4-dienoyl-CoA reductase-like NADH-dependent reductase (Old Yellow Enzyme family)
MYNGRMTRAMNKKDMEEVKQMYVDAAVLAVRSGFDGIGS